MKFVHMELNTSDPGAAKKFYKGLFGWKTSDMKMPDGSVYTMVASDKDGIGGIQKHPMPDSPPGWLGYVETASVKKSLAKVAKLGGKVIQDCTPLPDMGFIGIFQDPQGAVCAVWEPAKKAAKKKAVAKKKAAPKKKAKK